ncbi:hypothetical protein [Loktanella salsilacus]|uniref:hypothetical protein n=1 Tax=Loktanella salsilacus TaxID=195913 RepID=UPI0020B7DCAE|nr:hypothetical protein [Loktanella salsilacus]
MQAIDTGARELFVGSSVLKLVFGQFFAPDYLDKRLADDDVSSQKSDRPEPGLREGNLSAPVDYPSKAEGSYGDRQRDDGVIVDADMARKSVFIGLPVLALAAGFLLARRR